MNIFGLTVSRNKKDSDENREDFFDGFNWDLVNKDMAEYTLGEAKERLKSSLDIGDSLDKKSFIIIAGMATYVSVIIPTLSTHASTSFLLPSITLCVGFLISISILAISIKTRVIYGTGSEPSSTLYSMEKKKDYLTFLKWEIPAYQDWIENNLKINRIKARHINIALKTGVASTTISLLILVFFQLMCWISYQENQGFYQSLDYCPLSFLEGYRSD